MQPRFAHVHGEIKGRGWKKESHDAWEGGKNNRTKLGKNVEGKSSSLLKSSSLFELSSPDVRISSTCKEIVCLLVESVGVC